MSSPQDDKRHHDAADLNCKFHAEAVNAGETSPNPNRTCPTCARSTNVEA